MIAWFRRFSETRAFDLLAALPLVIFYSFAMAGLIILNAPRLEQLRRTRDWLDALNAASQLMGAAFLGLQVVLFLIRRLPVAKTEGIAPRVAALLGANLGMLYLAVPRAAMAPALAATSTILILLGWIGALCTASWLRRSYAIFPQARELVTGGPYRLVRHPLYLAELTAALGLMLQFEQPWTTFIFIGIVATQIPRMHYEEEVLSEAFPAYRDYKTKTARLIPGVY